MSEDKCLRYENMQLIVFGENIHKISDKMASFLCLTVMNGMGRHKYITSCLSRSQRSLAEQFTSGILQPVRLGRVESEPYFLLYWTCCDGLRM